MQFTDIKVKPCHEDWSKMSKEEKGRFCGMCQKTVLDFTGKKDISLAEEYKANNGNICGRFRVNQLFPKITWRQAPIWKSVAFSLVLLGVSKVGWAINGVDDSKVEEKTNENTEETKDALADTASHSIYVAGKAIDKNTGEAIPFANITIIVNGAVITGAISDIDGNFEIKTPREDIQSFDLQIQYIGYETYTVKDVNPDDNSILNTRTYALEENYVRIAMGIVVAIPKPEKGIKSGKNDSPNSSVIINYD